MILNINIQTKLGEGKQGKVFLGLDKSNSYKKYAVKISKIFYTNYLKSYLREIKFANLMYAKYPDHFLKLYDYEFEFNNHTILKLYDFDTNKTYLLTIWSLIDLTLKELINSWYTFNYKIYFDLFIQIIYCAYLINNEGYVHRDLKTENIGLVYTNKKYIDILGTIIPTHGFIVKIIDYGKVIKSKFAKYRNDIYYIFDRPCNSLLYDIINNNLFDIYNQAKLTQSHINNIKTYFYNNKDKNKIDHYFSFILKYGNISKNDSYKYIKNNDQLDTIKYLYKIINIDDFKHKYNDNIISNIKINNMITTDKLLYMIKKNFNILDILKFLINCR